MPSLILELHIPAERMLDYYRGVARMVHAMAINGQTVSFPAAALQRHVTLDGVHGWFELEFDGSRKLIRLDRADPPPAGIDHRA